MINLTEKEKFKTQIDALFEGYPFIKQMLQNIKQVMWILDLNTDQVIYVSPAFETVWGRSCESFIADPLTLINSVHPEDRVKVMSTSPDDNRKSTTQSYRILQPDGSLRWISADTFLLHDESSNTFYQMFIAQDITDKNKVDQTLRKALDRSREQFILSRRMSLARKPEAVLRTLMSASELSTAKRAFVLYFESPSHEVQVVTSWSSTAKQPNPNPDELFNEASLFEDLALSDLLHPSKPVIVTDISKDQRFTPLIRDLLIEEHIRTVSIFPMVAMGNWLGCFLVLFPQEKYFEPVELRHLKVMVDQATITLYNLQLLEIEAESRHEAERANEIKTKFLAMISHELRTPLTSIVGFTTTLLADDVTWEPDDQRDFIQTIRLEANRLQELINQLLDLSRLEAGMLSITQENRSIHEIIKDALPQLHILTSQQTLTLHLAPDLPPVYVDAKRIAQVLVNLVRNASTYSPAGTEITLSANTRGKFLQVKVTDQGPGIPLAEQKKVFKAFQRGANVENGVTQGAGLGLAICKGLIEAHGGRIWINKDTASGTTISFTLPLVPPTDSPVFPSAAER